MFASIRAVFYAITRGCYKTHTPIDKKMLASRSVHTTKFDDDHSLIYPRTKFLLNFMLTFGHLSPMMLCHICCFAHAQMSRLFYYCKIRIGKIDIWQMEFNLKIYKRIK